MASIWQIFGRGASSPTISEYLHLSKTNIHRISHLTSLESQPDEPLNPYQCRSMSSKLVRTLENIAALCYFCDKDSPSATTNTSTISTMALQNFYLVSQRAKELVESCCSADWCQASTFQIHNEEAFKEILLETGLCYSTMYQMVKNKVPFQDLRSTSTFGPPTAAEVVRDRMALLQRYQKFADTPPNSSSNSNENQKQHLAKHLMRRLSSFMSQSNIEDFDARELSLWPDGISTCDEWGKDSTFLGGNVFKTTWLDVPCAKKVFGDGVGEELILAEAKILAYLNHPNIVKLICCGNDSENSWCHFIAMEHMEKGLHSVIRKQAEANKGAPFPLLSAVDIMLQIAYGTCYLHDNGVAHRDLKTCNVVVRQMTTPHLQDYLQVKLIDFGLSKVKLSASKSNTISHPKTGTPAYMAPEAFQQGRANWFKADVYSFGITCSVILSGEEPFPMEVFERSKMYEAIRNGERPVLPGDTPEELACLIKECWDTDRNVRPNFVNICTRLAKLRHKLLRVDAHGHAVIDGDGSANLYMQGIFKKRSDARKQLLENIENEKVNLQRYLPKEPAESTILTTSYSSKTSGNFPDPTPLRTSASESFVDNKRRNSIFRLLGNACSMPTPFVFQAIPASQGSTSLEVQPSDLAGDLAVKLELVQLVNQNGGKMMLSKVSSEYKKVYGEPLRLARYNAQKFEHLIDKMKDTLVITGYGTSKSLQLAKKKGGCLTDKNKASGNQASLPKGDNEKKTSEDSNPEGVPPSKELEQGMTKAVSLLYKMLQNIGMVDSSGVDNVVDVKENEIMVQDFMGDVHRTNLSNFKHHLQELLVVYSHQIPLKDFITAYQQRFARTLDLPSFGVDSLDALFDKVKGVAVIKEKLESGVGRFFIMGTSMKFNYTIATNNAPLPTKSLSSGLHIPVQGVRNGDWTDYPSRITDE